VSRRTWGVWLRTKSGKFRRSTQKSAPDGKYGPEKSKRILNWHRRQGRKAGRRPDPMPDMYGAAPGTRGPAPGFVWGEVHSKDGVSIPTSMRHAAVRQAEALNQLRGHIRRALGTHRVIIHVTSWYRSPAHNAAVGGARNSQHMLGIATDITVSWVSESGRVQRLTPTSVAAYAELVDAYKHGGVGVYPSFTHLDVRGYRSRW
jgi:hypothetical protein